MMEVENKPIFRDLTPEQINDLIATKIMGWHRSSDTDPHCNWLTPEAGATGITFTGYSRECDYEYSPTEGDWDCNTDFNPYWDLNACRVAEGVILQPDTDRSMELYVYYVVRVAQINAQDFHLKDIQKVEESGTGNPTMPRPPCAYSERAVWFFVAHATSQEKCEAMLRAIREIQ